MLPILISLSVAPVSYFFCASAEPASGRRDASARDGERDCLQLHGPVSLDGRLSGWHKITRGTDAEREDGVNPPVPALV